MKKILIIDDDEKLNRLLMGFFSKYGYETLSATRPSEAMILLEKATPHIIVLDVMLPEMDGFQVCREIRKRHSIPIIMLTARGDVTDRIVGLELGADDYMPKPFEPRELLARIQSILRRSGSEQHGGTSRFGNLEIQHDTYTVLIDGERVDLTTMEFELLSLLSRNPGKVFDRDSLFEKTKGLDADSYDRSIDVAISRLRAKIGDDPRSPRFIRTVRGTGYRFIGKRES